MNPLFQAAGKGNLAALRQGIAEGFPLDETDGKGDSPLTHACREGQVEAARLLLEAGADVNVRQSRDTFETPLSAAAFRGHFEVVKLLVARGADTAIYAGLWQVPAEVYARRAGFHAISEYLECVKDRDQERGDAA